MKEISAEELRLHFHYDPQNGEFIRRGEHAPSGRIATKGYRQIFILGKRHMAHRLAWLYVNGEWPTKQLDHINRDKDDNRIANLREVDNQQNQENVELWKHNTTGFRGVNRGKNGKFGADIKVNGKTIHLGTFTTLEAAASARMKAEQKHFQLLDNSPIYSRITHGEIVRVGNGAYSTEAPGTKLVR